MADIDSVVDSRGGSEPLSPSLPDRSGGPLVVNRFESVSSDEECSLLRVTGRYDTGGEGALTAARRLAGAKLLIGGGGDFFRIDALPDPNALNPLPESGHWLWHAGFVVPREVLKSRRTVFAIEADDDVLLELPHSAGMR